MSKLTTTKCHKHVIKDIYVFEQSAKAFMFVGYCPQTLDYYLVLYEKALKSFPHIKFEDCECGKVSKSSFRYGFTILTFNLKLNQVTKKIKGWNTYNKEHLDFNW